MPALKPKLRHGLQHLRKMGRMNFNDAIDEEKDAP